METNWTSYHAGSVAGTLILQFTSVSKVEASIVSDGLQPHTHVLMYSYNESQRDALFLKFI